MLRVKSGAAFSRSDLARHLDSRRIGNRMLFGGNLVRQPVFVELKQGRPDAFRMVSNLEGADAIMNQALFIGTYPGLSRPMLDYMVETIRDFVLAKSGIRG
jgi:CDP-6-deoxy-D-xylo-4-hexulose-3-dehydrase